MESRIKTSTVRMYSGNVVLKTGCEGYNWLERARGIILTEPDRLEIHDVGARVYCIAYVPEDRRYHVGR